MRGFVVLVVLLSTVACKRKAKVEPIDPDAASHDALADRMCACKDAACADKVDEEVTKWFAERQRHPRTLPPEDLQRMRQAGNRMADCMARVLTSAPEKPVPPEPGKPRMKPNAY